MKIVMFVVIITMTSGAFALSNDSRALKACRSAPDAEVRKQCVETVKGHRFDNKAVEVCSRDVTYNDSYGPFALQCLREIRGQKYDREALFACERVLKEENLLTCLRMIAGRKTIKEKALRPCSTITNDETMLACLRGVTWRPLSSEAETNIIGGGAEAETSK